MKLERKVLLLFIVSQIFHEEQTVISFQINVNCETKMKFYYLLFH